MTIVAFPGAANEEPTEPKRPDSRNEAFAQQLEMMAAAVRAGQHGEMIRCSVVVSALMNKGKPQKETRVAIMQNANPDWARTYMDLQVAARQIEAWYPE